MHCHHPHFPRFFGRRPGGYGAAGRFGGWFADGGELGGRGFGMGRKLGSSDLQLLILKLLADKPRHGYEVIKALDELSRGFYVPSPGMVYPALTYLEEISHATVATDGTRKLYSITQDGRQHLSEHGSVAEALVTQFQRVGERMEHLRRAMRSRAERDSEGFDGDDRRGAGEPLLRAHRALKAALADKRDSSPEEQQRIADILRRATDAIARRAPE
jgi:DNA-binding PadR family transcriptional regulator